MVKKTDKSTDKKDVTVAQFAEEIGVKADRLLGQFKDAGVRVAKTTDTISEGQKQKLLRYLREHHGAKNGDGTEKIVVRRARTSEIKVGGGHHSSAGKTVSIQVRKKRTYVKRSVLEEDKKPDVEEKPVAAPVVEETPAQEVKEQKVVAKEEKVAAVKEDKTDVNDTVPAETKPVDKKAEEETKAAPKKAKEETAKDKVPEKPVAKKSEKDDKDDKSTTVKRKEKHRADGDDADKQKKRRRSRGGDATRTTDKNFESLLARGADLKRVLSSADEDASDFGGRRSGRGRSHGAKVKVQAFTKPTAPMIRDVEIPETIIISDLAQRMSVKAAEVVRSLFKMGVVATINQSIEQEIAAIVVEELGHKPKLVSADEIEHALVKSLAVDEGDAMHRPPVITIMGHVDHGKTTLLDYVRTTKVAASEAGGITQHIGAYHVQIPKGTITFLDTPGHAAFTAMRARGAKLTDIVVLVVAADDGVMPQTIEAIEHAQAANVPLIIAVNKMDKQGIDPDRVKNELSKYNLIPEEWGGDTMFVPISAKTGMGVDELLDSVLVQAEMLALKAVEDCPAQGVVIESRLERGRGAVMSVLVQQGTLRKGDTILAGLEYGRIRGVFDETGQAVQSAGPSIPVEVLGLSGVPQAGDDFMIVRDERKAREVAMFRQNKHRETKLARSAPKLEDLMQRIEDEKSTTTTLNLVVKADVLGSVEALRQALTELSNDEVKIHIIASGIGGINESDVNLAIASKAIIVAFNVRANAEARKLMEKSGVDVHYYNIIYDVINEVKKAISGALAPEIHEKVVGLAEVREVFRSSKTGTIAGCMVTEGAVKRNLPIRVLRDNVVIFEGVLESLRRFKEDAGEVTHGKECGIAVKNYSDVKVGDQIEVYEKVEVKREVI